MAPTTAVLMTADSPADFIGQPVPDIAATLGHGAIEGLRRIGEGRYEIRGEFGQVKIDAERPLLRLKGQLA